MLKTVPSDFDHSVYVEAVPETQTIKIYNVFNNINIKNTQKLNTIRFTRRGTSQQSNESAIFFLYLHLEIIHSFHLLLCI